MLSISVQLSVNIRGGGGGLCNKKMFKEGEECRREKVKYEPNNGQLPDSRL